MTNRGNIALGTAYYGTRIKKELSFSLLDYFYESGGTIIDSANSYASWEVNGSGGDSEKIIAEWHKSRNNRKKIKIISKVGFGYSSVPNGLKRERILDECHKSLERLKTNYIDYYLAHLDDKTRNLTETIKTFQNLISEGKILNWGISNYTSARLCKIIDICNINNWIKPKVIQNHYSLLKVTDHNTFDQMSWEALNEDILKTCIKEDIIPMAHTSLLWGAYTRDDKPLWGSFNSELNNKVISRIKEKSKAENSTPNQYVLSYIIKHKPSIVPVIGVSTIDQLKENLGVIT